MEVIILPDAAAIGAVAADAIEALLHRTPDAVLGLATRAWFGRRTVP